MRGWMKGEPDAGRPDAAEPNAREPDAGAPHAAHPHQQRVNKEQAACRLFVVPLLVVLDRWRPPFGIAIVLGVVLLTMLAVDRKSVV